MCENNGNLEPPSEEERSLSGKNFAHSGPAPIIPSSSLPVEYLEAPSEYSESSVQGSTAEPPLSEIQSENLAADSHIFPKLEEKYPRIDSKMWPIVDSEAVPSKT